MKHIAPLLGLLTMLLCVPTVTAGPQDPYPLYGFVVYENGTVVGAGATVTFRNVATGEVISDDTSASGWYMDDAANFPSGYQDGQTITYSTVFGEYTNTTSHVIDVAIGSCNMNITLGNASGGGWVPREITATPQATINESAYDQFDDAMNAANPSWTDFTDAIANPYIAAIGSIFYLFLFGVPLLMIYIRQDSMNVPATIVFMFGAFIIVLLPPQWQTIGGGLLALALFGAVYSFMKERER